MSDTSSLGSPDITAQVVRALTLYSLAEAQAGHASAIRVSAAVTSFSITDDGRGHAIDRTVAGLPYLKFIYTHLDYPFAASEGGPVQLQGIGMSLLNALCSELSVTVRKADGAMRLQYRAGRLVDEARFELPAEPTGNTVSGIVRPDLQRIETNTEHIEQWLVSVLVSNPSLKLHFNDKELRALQASAV
jgi:DNA gyrase subunit B